MGFSWHLDSATGKGVGGLQNKLPCWHGQPLKWAKAGVCSLPRRNWETAPETHRPALGVGVAVGGVGQIKRSQKGKALLGFQRNMKRTWARLI